MTRDTTTNIGYTSSEQIRLAFNDGWLGAEASTPIKTGLTNEQNRTTYLYCAKR